MDAHHKAQRLGWRFMAGALVVLAMVAFAGEAGCSGMSDSQSTLEERFATARQLMVREQIERRGIRDSTVLAAMSQVPRHMFVPEALRDRAYDDTPLPIGQGQTISQPYIVAYMTEAIRPQTGDRVLEVGTGSGYQAAVLARIV